jgi:CheY-like chemotaxis protein
MAGGGGGGVLIVEDDEDIRADLAAILRVKGFVVEESANGRDALTRLESGPPPCVLILDLMMPVMNGWELRAVMRAHPTLRDIPVVVVSGAGRIDPKEVDALEAVAVLVKPFELTQLLELVGRYCPRRQAAPAAR